MPDVEDLARIFNVLSVPTRVRMLELIKSRPLCVNALAAQAGITPAAASQHLRILRDAGVVKAEKRGYYVHYLVNPSVLARWRSWADGFLKPEEEEPEHV